ENIDRQIAIRGGLVEDLGDDGPAPAAAKEGSAPPAVVKKPALGLDAYRDRWKAKAREHDDFPSGYFEIEDGTMIALRIVSFTTGMGDFAYDTVLGHFARV